MIYTTDSPQNRTERKRHKKLERKRRLESDFSYRLIDEISRYMDRYYVDPIIGFIFPTFGDIISTVMVLPYLYISVFKIKSVSLTLALLYNTMLDVLVSLIPFCIGDFLDIFHRSYTKNYRLIRGFVEDDKEVIRAINSKAWKTGAFIAVLALLIAGMTFLTLRLIDRTWVFLAGLFA